MRIRRNTVCFVTTFVLGISALQMATTAASPNQTPTAITTPLSSAKTGASGASIPDTTLAINSDKPMSQRLVHYEIDAKYDAAKHTVDATETLTYHNLTGQALDHFPFHL